MGRVLDRWGISASLYYLRYPGAAWESGPVHLLHGVDEHEACHLLWVHIGVQSHDQPTKGVPHQDIRTRDTSPDEERVQFRNHAPSRAREWTCIAPTIACTVV
jgi:hypothetical protein